MAILQDLTLGQFIPADSPIHRLDPRTKLCSTYDRPDVGVRLIGIPSDTDLVVGHQPALMFASAYDIEQSACLPVAASDYIHRPCLLYTGIVGCHRGIHAPGADSGGIGPGHDIHVTSNYHYDDSCNLDADYSAAGCLRWPREPA